MEQIKFKIGHARSKEQIRFTLRMISVAEESKFLQRFNDLADNEDRASKEYDIYVDALADWSVEMPVKIDGDGKETPLGEADPAAAVREYFGDRTAAKEWLVDYSIRAFRSQLQPSVSFL